MIIQRVLGKISRFHRLWVTLLLLSYLGFNYVVVYGRWYSAIATILIILFGYLAWPAGFRQYLGIPLKLKTYINIFILIPILMVLTYWLFGYICSTKGIKMQALEIFRLDHFFFYTLNEELILGALLLFTLKLKFSKVDPLILSCSAAILFSIMHYIMYRWVFQTNAELNLLTIISLFLIGVARNNLILFTGHIGYSWALHFSSIKIMFGFIWIYSETRRPLSEVETFNTFLGNELTLILVLFLATATLILKPRESIKTS